MEHDFFSRKGQKGFNLVMVIWPVSIFGVALIYSLITIGVGQFLGMERIFGWWLSGLKYVTYSALVILGALHWKISRKWNLEKAEDEFGEKVLFIPAEYWSVLPFLIGLGGLALSLSRNFQ